MMTIGIDIPLTDFERRDREETKQLKAYPICEHCGEPITDDKLFDLGGNELYHIECAEERFIKSTADYIDEE